MTCALAIGGLDPGGGAGLLADLRAFHAAGVFGCAVVTIVTAQSTSGLAAVEPVPARQVLAQARAVLKNQRVGAIKVGALGSAANVGAVIELLSAHRDLPAVVDPVMQPTRGRARLLAERALRAMRTGLVPRATIVTANVPEAAALTGRRVTTLADARDAARAIVAMGARSALVKGGHLVGPDSVDVLATADGVQDIGARRLRLRTAVHGGGCTLASLVAGRLASQGGDLSDDDTILDAVRWAKKAHRALLSRAIDVGGEMRVLVP